MKNQHFSKQQTEQPDDVHTVGKSAPIGAFLIASSLVGLTAGLFAGMSESPVATALVGGIFGLIGGGGIFGLLVQARKGNGEENKDETAGSSLHALGPPAAATSFLCVFCILGVFAGAGFREGWLLPQPSKDKASLLNIANAAKGLPRSLQLKLVILQSELASLGVSANQNNQFVSSYIAANGENNPKALMEDESLRGMKHHVRDAVIAIEHALSALSEEPENPDEDDDKHRKVKPVEKVTYGNVKEAFAYLKVASDLAHSTEDSILEATAPELSLVLDLISRYREAELNQPTGGRAGPLIRHPDFFKTDPKNRVSIKP
jgi:hypothetical protein